MMFPDETLIVCIAIALCFAIVGAATWYESRHQREESKRLSVARQARIAELRAARLIRESRHAKRSDLDLELRGLVSAALADELGRR